MRVTDHLSRAFRWRANAQRAAVLGAAILVIGSVLTFGLAVGPLPAGIGKAVRLDRSIAAITRHQPTTHRLTNRHHHARRTHHVRGLRRGIRDRNGRDRNSRTRNGRVRHTREGRDPAYRHGGRAPRAPAHHARPSHSFGLRAVANGTRACAHDQPTRPTCR